MIYIKTQKNGLNKQSDMERFQIFISLSLNNSSSPILKSSTSFPFSYPSFFPFS